MECLIVGCGLCGSVVARTLAEKGWRIQIIDRRFHVGGNLYDYYDENGILVQKYGPHSFFTNHLEIKEYVEKFEPTFDSYPEYVTYINGQPLPMPFNFQSIDLLYAPDKAKELKEELTAAFPGRETVAVTEVILHSNPLIAEYGRFMYENEYRLYSAKQWGRPIEEMSPEVFRRVPVYLSYKRAYQPHPYQFLPQHGFTAWIKKILDHPNIKISLKTTEEEQLSLRNADHSIWRQNRQITCPVVYTGAADELFNYQYGVLPYRSLEFIWRTLDQAEFQKTPLAAYPQAEKITRITEYTRLPPQKANGKTVIAIEIPFEYDKTAPVGNEPYYPILNDETKVRYQKYKQLAEEYPNLYLAGRLGDYRYYNMDDAILRAWEISEQIYTKGEKKSI